ncbi:MAG: hypothetical protein HC781_18370 [Leptolyngbyaceae cyanobacterium CSU_1_4]|nr:hypothetical protein [Leptolyngbyaceae cyanobacterium CSU_1_4]
MAEVSTRLYWLFQSLIDFTPYLLAGLLAGAVVLSVCVFLARFWLWKWLLPFEESCLLALKAQANPTLDRYMTAVTWLAQGEITIPLLVMIGGILVYRNGCGCSLGLGDRAGWFMAAEWHLQVFLSAQTPRPLGFPRSSNGL